MSNITFQQFLELINKYDKFDEEILDAMYEEFGKEKINNYFEKYYQNLEEEESLEFTKKYSAYFERQLKDFEKKENSIKILDDTAGMIINNTYNFPIMDAKFEREQGLILAEARDNLKIIKSLEDDYVLYPNLEIEKILLSIKSQEDLKSLSLLKKLPYTLGDDSILKNDLSYIKKYLKFSNGKILNLNELKNLFPELSFDNIKPVENFEYQVELLRRYIIAKFNFYNRNLRLVVYIAKKGSNVVPLEDKLQEGNLCLIKAINRYNVSKGYKFSTYAIWWIRQGVLRYFANNAYVIRKPVHLIDKINRYNKFVDDYKLVNGVAPSLEEISEALEMTREDILNLQTVSLDILSLDKPLDDDDVDQTIGDFIIDDNVTIEKDYISSDVVNTIKKALLNSDKISVRDKEILIKRWGLDFSGREYTLQELGHMYRLTRERVTS